MTGTDITDLIDRLLRLDGWSVGGHHYGAKTAVEAAAEIEALRALVAELQADNDALTMAAEEHREVHGETLARLTELEARTTPPEGIEIADVRRWMNSVRASRSFIESSEGGADVIGSQMWGFRLIEHAYGTGDDR